MALSGTFINVLADLKRSGYLPPQPMVIEIGAQQLSNNALDSKDELAMLGHLFGVRPEPDFGNPKSTGIAHGSLEHLSPDAPPARDFYQWLGFEYSAIDIDGTPGSVPLDLNFDEAPATHRRSYHLVTNCGTTEHLANQLNAFKVIHDLCAVDGVMVHELPFQGYMNHGLINYNPKFFWMLARSNGYETILMDFSAGGMGYDVPDNILEFVGKFARVTNRSPFKTTDAGLLVVLRKTFDIRSFPHLMLRRGRTRSIRRCRSVTGRSSIRTPSGSRGCGSSRFPSWQRVC